MSVPLPIQAEAFKISKTRKPQWCCVVPTSPLLEKYFRTNYRLNWSEKSQKPLIQEPEFKNTKVVQFWKSNMWLNGKFYKESKYLFCKISFLQKGPQFRV